MSSRVSQIQKDIIAISKLSEDLPKSARAGPRILDLQDLVHADLLSRGHLTSTVDGSCFDGVRYEPRSILLVRLKDMRIGAIVFVCVSYRLQPKCYITIWAAVGFEGREALNRRPSTWLSWVQAGGAPKGSLVEASTFYGREAPRLGP